MPRLVPPMQPSAGSGQPPVGADWTVELAWTGHRCIAYVEPGQRTRLLSANNVSMTAAYPELGPPLERRSPPGGMVLDGTLVARGEEHAPRARLLKRRSAPVQPQRRAHPRRPGRLPGGRPALAGRAQHGGAALPGSALAAGGARVRGRAGLDHVPAADVRAEPRCCGSPTPRAWTRCTRDTWDPGTSRAGVRRCG